MTTILKQLGDMVNAAAITAVAGIVVGVVLIGCQGHIESETTFILRDEPLPKRDSTLPHLVRDPYQEDYARFCYGATILDTLFDAYIRRNNRLPIGSGRYALYDICAECCEPNAMDTVYFYRYLRDSGREYVVVPAMIGTSGASYIYTLAIPTSFGCIYKFYFTGRNRRDEQGSGDDILILEKRITL